MQPGLDTQYWVGNMLCISPRRQTPRRHLQRHSISNASVLCSKRFYDFIGAVMRTNIFRDASLEVINASFLEEVCRHNVLPFVLPFNTKVGKLSELCGFLKRNGAAEKHVSALPMHHH